MTIDYLDEFVRDVRGIFPAAGLIEVVTEYGEHRPVKKCIICGAEYLGWPESQYCSNACVAVGHRQHKNPSKLRIQCLRERCRRNGARSPEFRSVTDWQQSLLEPLDDEARLASTLKFLENFETWLEQMREEHAETERVAAENLEKIKGSR
jgi:hypothetical protein